MQKTHVPVLRSLGLLLALSMLVLFTGCGAAKNLLNSSPKYSLTSTPTGNVTASGSTLTGTVTFNVAGGPTTGYASCTCSGSIIYSMVAANSIAGNTASLTVTGGYSGTPTGASHRIDTVFIGTGNYGSGGGTYDGTAYTATSSESTYYFNNVSYDGSTYSTDLGGDSGVAVGTFNF